VSIIGEKNSKNRKILLNKNFNLETLFLGSAKFLIFDPKCFEDSIEGKYKEFYDELIDFRFTKPKNWF
jgi:hypothetical protein